MFESLLGAKQSLLIAGESFTMFGLETQNTPQKEHGSRKTIIVSEAWYHLEEAAGGLLDQDILCHSQGHYPSGS